MPEQPITFRQVRKVSGFSRPMSVVDAFIYNFLAMGVIFPWTYLWGPASFPGGHVELAICLTFVAQFPISLAYCYLSSVMPVTGGDYVYQTRAFGKWGFISVMSGFVIWILQWVALSGWLFATLALAPLLLCLGVFTNTPVLCRWAVYFQSPWGVVVVSTALALCTTLFLIRGLRLYVRVQRFLFGATIAAVAAVVYIYLTSQSAFVQHLNAFVQALSGHLGLSLPPEMANNFVSFLKSDVAKSGGKLSPPFSFWATLGIVPIAWTSLQWATYSVEQNEEIAEAERFSKQAFILIASALCVTGALWLVAHVEHGAVSSEFVNAAAAAYWNQQASPQTVQLLKTVLQPFPNILAMAASGGVVFSIIIAFGFFANAFQITCNCFIGVTRIIVAMAGDGFLSRRLKLDAIHPHWHAPVRAHWAYLLASLPWIVCYNLVPSWATLTLGVTFACGYVFTLSALAATRIPTKMYSMWSTSEIATTSPRVIKSVGYLGFLSGVSMVLAYLVLPQLGITGTLPYMVVLGIVVLSYLVYYFARLSNPKVDKVLGNAPEEIFYREIGA